MYNAVKGEHRETVVLLMALRASVDMQGGGTGGYTLLSNSVMLGNAACMRLLISLRADVNLGSGLGTPICRAAQFNKPECIAILVAAKASLEGSPIGVAAHMGGDDSVRLLAYLGARLVLPGATLSGGGAAGFWHLFKDSMGCVRDPSLWERIVRKGGDEGTPESLRKRIRMLKKAGVNDPRDGTSW